MTVILCVDDNMGMTFLGKRLSKDRELRKRIRELCGEKKLLMNGYSAGQFDGDGAVTVCESFLENGGEGDICFVENCDIVPHIQKLSRLVVYKWNRVYPSDVRLTLPIEESGFELVSVFDFKGYSHEKITETVYVRHP